MPCECLISRTRLAALGPRFADARFSRLEHDARAIGRSLHTSVLLARDELQREPQASYFLWGGYGTWKTYLAACQFNELLDRYGPGSVRFFSDMEVYQELRAYETGQRWPKISDADIRMRLIRHLVIDDLGKKPVSSFIRGAYFSLIDEIYRARGVVGITLTSNFPLTGLSYDHQDQDIYDPGMIRRIEHTCTVLELKDERRRPK